MPPVGKLDIPVPINIVIPDGQIRPNEGAPLTFGIHPSGLITVLEQVAGAGERRGRGGGRIGGRGSGGRSRSGRGRRFKHHRRIRINGPVAARTAPFARTCRSGGRGDRGGGSGGDAGRPQPVNASPEEHGRVAPGQTGMGPPDHPGQLLLGYPAVGAERTVRVTPEPPLFACVVDVRAARVVCLDIGEGLPQHHAHANAHQGRHCHCGVPGRVSKF